MRRFIARPAALVVTVAALIAVAGCSGSAAPDEAASAPDGGSAAEDFESTVAELPERDRIEVFDEAMREGRTGVARKTRPVDARPAEPDEIITTVIEGDGVETVSEPAAEGDMVVRNRCPETGDEEILVQAEKFPERYGAAQSEPDAEGYREHLPTGVEMPYFLVSDDDGEFAMEAPWGEMQVFKPGDAVVQNPADETDIYRIYSASFACTYEIIEPAQE